MALARSIGVQKVTTCGGGIRIEVLAARLTVRRVEDGKFIGRTCYGDVR